jgi:hypothetical protein
VHVSERPVLIDLIFFIVCFLSLQLLENEEAHDKKDEVDQNWTFAYMHNWAIYLISVFVSKCVTQENSHTNENSAYDQ